VGAPYTALAMPLRDLHVSTNRVPSALDVSLCSVCSVFWCVLCVLFFGVFPFRPRLCCVWCLMF